MNTDTSSIRDSSTIKAELVDARSRLTAAQTAETRAREIETRIEALTQKSAVMDTDKTAYKNLAAAARTAKRAALDISVIETEARKALPDFMSFGMSLSDGTRKACDVGSKHGLTGAVLSETSGGESAALLGALGTVFAKKASDGNYVVLDLPDVSWHPEYLRQTMQSLAAFDGQVIICSTVLPGEVFNGLDPDDNPVSVTYVDVPAPWQVVDLDELLNPTDDQGAVSAAAAGD